MYQEGTDHLIWSNYHTDFEDWKESTSEDYEDYSEDRLYEIFCEAISDNLDDERCNLNIQVIFPDFGHRRSRTLVRQTHRI